MQDVNFLTRNLFQATPGGRFTCSPRDTDMSMSQNLHPPNVPFYFPILCIKIIISCRIIQIYTHRRTRSSLSTCRSLGSFRKTSRNYQGPNPPIVLSRNYCCQRIPTMHQYVTKQFFFRDQISFLDIASARPLVTIGSQAFVGEYEDAVGTSVFFKQSPAKGARDPVFGRQPATQVSYLEHTRKKLQLKRVFLNKKPKLDAKNTEPPNSDQKSPKPSCSPPER